MCEHFMHTSVKRVTYIRNKLEFATHTCSKTCVEDVCVYEKKTNNISLFPSNSFLN